nr:reverse transcriptase domain-containing protein [Tanacetum cinerariifolium]
MTAHHNDWDTSAQRSESSSSITSSFDSKIVALKAKMAEINKNLMKVLRINQQVKAVASNCETCGGPHSYNDCPATVGQTQNVYAAGAYQGGNSYQPQGPMIPTTSSSPPKVVERVTEVTKDTVPSTNNKSTKDVQPLIIQVETLIPNSEPVVAPVIEPVVALTKKALIDVYEAELTLRVGKEAVYSQEVLDFSNVIASGNPIPYYDPIVSTSSSTLTPFGDSDFLLEEVDAFLALEDDPTSLEVDHSYYDMEGNIYFLEAFLNDDTSLPPPTQGMVNPKIHDVIKKEVKKLLDAEVSYPISNSPWGGVYVLTTETSHFMVKEGIVLGHKISKNGIEVDKAKVDVIVKLPHPITVNGIRSFLGHAGLY